MKKNVSIFSGLIMLAFVLAGQLSAIAQQRPTRASQLIKQKLVVSKSSLSNRARIPADLYVYKQPSQRMSQAPVVNRTSSCSLDTIKLTTQAQVNNFATTYATCTSPKYLIVDGLGASPAITSLSGLSSVTQVINKLSISNTSITNLSQLTNLTEIGTLELHDNNSLTGIGLNNLTILEALHLRGLPALTSIAGLSNHITGMGNIFMDTTALTSFAGLSGLTSMGDLEIRHTPITNLSSINNNLQSMGFLWLQDDAQLTSLGLTNLTHLDGIVVWDETGFTNLGPLTHKLTNKDLSTTFIYNTGLTSLAGMDSVTSWQNVFIGANANLLTLHGFENVTASDAGLSIWYNGALTDLSALSKLATINYGRLEISGDATLTNLNGLGSLSIIGGGFWMQDNAAMTTLDGLNNNLIIQSNSGDAESDTLRFQNNYQLAVCSSTPICNFLSVNSSSAVISDNAPGCNDITEVRASCTSTTCTGGELKQWTGNISDDWTDEGNWLPASVPTPCDSIFIPGSLSTYPVLPGNTTISGLRMEEGSSLDMASFTLTNNGNIKIETATITNAGALIDSAAISPLIENSKITASLALYNYSGALGMRKNHITGDVTLSDNPIRTNPATLDGNYISGDLTITANSPNSSAITSVSRTYKDTVAGDVHFNQNTDVDFFVGFNSVTFFTAARDLVLNSNFSNTLHLTAIDFNSLGNNGRITQLGTGQVKIDQMFLNKYAGYFTIDQNVTITNRLEFVRGWIVTTHDKLLVFGNNASWGFNFGYSFVDGPVKKIGNQPFQFPLGDVIGDSIYRAPAFISAPALATDAYVASYNHISPTLAGYDTALHVSSLQSVKGIEYWIIDQVTGNSPVQINLSYDSARMGGIPLNTDLRIANWNGSQWTNKGNGLTNGTTSAGQIYSLGNISVGGPYALGVAPHRIPIITVGNTDSIGCAASNFNVPFTIDTLMTTGNAFIAQLSDSSGNFATGTTIIGSLSSNDSGIIPCFIPGNVPEGLHYRVRVIGNRPADTSVNYRNVVIKPFPDFNIAISGPPTSCISGGIHKYFVTNPQQNVIYTWVLSGGGTMTTNYDTAYVTWTTLGNYALRVTVANFCRTGNTASRGIVVMQAGPTETPVITNTGRRLFSSAPAATQNVTAYQWYKNDVLINGATENSYYATAGGTFKVKYTNICGESPASNGITFAAASLPQTITFTSISNKTYGDAAFNLPATASSGLPVSFNIVSGPGNIPGNVYNITGTGVVTIRATQPGNDIYDTAAPVAVTFTVNKAAQTISFPVITPKDYLNAIPFKLNATSNSNLPVGYTVLAGPATVNDSAATLTGIGTITIRATQTGDTNYLAAPNADRTFCASVSSLDHITGPPSICPANNATYQVNAIPGATYTWKIAGGSILSSTTNSVTLAWPAVGTYTLIASAVGNCGAPSKSDSLVVTAISSVLPDSVHNMLPTTGAINQQLPLTLSWIPAHPELFYTYDVYIWRSDLPQPSTPFVSNLHSVNYVIPITSGLAYGQTYKWMVAAHNGSCVVTNGGPIQTFSLIPLPDLEVYNVKAPASGFSGQQLTVTWKVKNNGPGNTQLNQRWNDAIFISRDSVLQITPSNNFPSNPQLVAIVPNVTALNSGEFYSDTATFTTPVTFGGNMYVHVVTNYAPPAINPVYETTTSNDTAHALPLTNVILSPQPDLRVDTVFNPNNTFSGSTINITYKIKNYGVNATGNWGDAVYISKDPIFNIDNALPLKSPNQNGTYYPYSDIAPAHYGGLEHDSSYTVSFPVVVPNFIFGSYYIYVRTNPGGVLFEGPNDQNNINHGPVLQVFLTPTPKLVPVNLTVSPNLSTTQQATINWTIRNQGAYDNREKNKGHYWVKEFGTCGFQSFFFRYRDSIGFGSSYWTDKVYISQDSSGLNLANAILVSEIPHGLATNFTSDAPYATSECGVAPPVNINTSTAILPNAEFPASFSFPVPSNFPIGDYYFYVLANASKTVYEYPGDQQIVRSNKISILNSDLTVPSITLPPSGNSGQSLTIKYDVVNIGPGAVYSATRNDYFYISNNPTFDGTAVLLGSANYPFASLPVNVTQSLQKIVTLPNGISGTKYIFVRVNGDPSFGEVTYANNINAAGTAINIGLTPPPDLVVSSVSIPDSIFSIIGFPFKYTVTNAGAGVAAGTWKDSIFISCSNTFNSASSFFIGSRVHPTYILPSASYTDSFQMVIPLTFFINDAGCLHNDTANVYFFVKTNSDNGLYEAPPNSNNTGVTSQKTVINALVDQIVTNVSSGDSATIGRNFSLSWTVKNIGYNAYDNAYYTWADAYYLSPDSVINGNAIFLGFVSKFEPLEHNVSATTSQSFTMPSVPEGDYYLHVRTNASHQIRGERNVSNNDNLRRNAAGIPLKIHVSTGPLGDAVDSILTAPALIATGQPVKIVYKVNNIGPGAMNSNIWYDNIWLSNDLQPEGLLLGSKTHSTLNAGQSYKDSIIATIPPNFIQGNYVIVVRANAGFNAFESNYTNNTAYQYMTVYSPAPVDLIVKNIFVTDTLALGDAVNVNWTLANNSNNPANGFETDGVFLSKDSLPGSPDNILIGTNQHFLKILPASDTLLNAQPVVSGVTEGSYFLKVKTDILNNILETDRLNNTTVRTNRVYVKVKTLPINVSTSDTVRPGYLFYKLIVPLSLKGKTISVNLTSNDSTTANNQMYIGLGYLPSAAHFDFGYSVPNYGNQKIIIESAVDSVYYIAAKGTKIGNGNQVVKLIAVELPFAITSLAASHGGNTGNVTVQIKGSLFTTGMIARLHGISQNNNIPASAVYFSNGTTTYATFNLAGVPLGLYDVILKKADSSAAILPASFTVELTNNGGLITGTGPNTGQNGSGNAPGCDPGATSGLNSQLQTQIIAPPNVYASWPFIMQINYTNTSNVDIPAQIKVLYSLDKSPLSFTEAGLDDNNTTLVIEFKDSTGPTNTIRAGGTGTVRVYSRAPLGTAAHIILHYSFQ